MVVEKEQSLMASLLAKKARLTEIIEAEPDRDFSMVMQVIDRQIRQAAHGNPITGEGVTKSNETEPSAS